MKIRERKDSLYIVFCQARGTSRSHYAGCDAPFSSLANPFYYQSIQGETSVPVTIPTRALWSEIVTDVAKKETALHANPRPSSERLPEFGFAGLSYVHRLDRIGQGLYGTFAQIDEKRLPAKGQSVSAGQKRLLVINCGQLLTLKGPRGPRRGAEMRELGLIRKGALLIKGERIEQVGPQDQIFRSPLARAARQVDAGGKVVLPGFVDSHTHALFTASRVDEYEARIRGATYSQIASAGGGIQASAKQIRHAGERGLVRRLLDALRLFVEYGTTTVEIKSGYGLDPSQELKMLRAIRGAAQASPLDLVPTLLIHDVAARYRSRRTAYLRAVIDRLIPQVRRARLAECFDVFCDRGYFSIAETRALLTAAAQAGFRLKIHAEQLARSGAARMASDLCALSADHLDHLRDADMPRLRRHGTIATLLPGSVLHLASGPFPPARRLLEAGVPVALASNYNPGSSPTVNMQMILSLACSQMRMTPAEAVTAATINGSYALGRGHLVGSLEPGKQADVTIMDVEDYREIPYYFGMNHCLAVLKKGQVLYTKDKSWLE